MERRLTADDTVSVVAPVYNERENIETFVEEVRSSLSSLGLPACGELVLVNDGSRDGSAELMDALARTHPDEVKAVHLARNFGHAAAVSAGLDHASGQVVIVMDSDLQDDPAAFGPFIEKWCEGYDVVYAVRAARKERAPIRFLSWCFYRVLGWIANLEIPLDAGDFALMDRRVVDLVRKLPERNRYLPGLRAYVGFAHAGVTVVRRARYDKRSRVGFRGLWARAMNAIFSFSYVPLFVFRLGGVSVLIFCAGLITWAMYHRLFTGLAIKAWTSQLVTTSFFGGINLLGIGVLGEYIARIYDEVKMRPPYVVARVSGARDRDEAG